METSVISYGQITEQQRLGRGGVLNIFLPVGSFRNMHKVRVTSG